MAIDIFKSKETPLARVERGLRTIENEVFEEAVEVLRAGIGDAWDINPEMPDELPEAWLDEIIDAPEEQRAELRVKMTRRKRIAQAALLSPKNAPIAFHLARGVFVGMQKARALEGQGNKTLNVNVVTINQPTIVYEEKEIDHE